MAAAAPTPKKRKSSAVNEVAFDTVVESTHHRDVAYVSSQIKGDAEMASFLASMIRDGEVQRAIHRNKQSLLSATLGKKLPPRCKRFKQLPKAMCQELVQFFLGRNLVFGENQSEPTAMAWRTSLCVGLRVTLDTALPSLQCYPEYEGTMKAVLVARGAQVRASVCLTTLTEQNIEKFGNYVHNPDGDLKKVTCLFDNMAPITLPFPDSYFSPEFTWEVRNNDSMYEAEITCFEKSTSQGLWSLYQAAYPTGTPAPDNEWFEIPEAAQGFNDVQAGTPSVSSAPPAGVASEGTSLGGSVASGSPAGSASLIPLPTL